MRPAALLVAGVLLLGLGVNARLVVLQNDGEQQQQEPMPWLIYTSDASSQQGSGEGDLPSLRHPITWFYAQLDAIEALQRAAVSSLADAEDDGDAVHHVGCNRFRDAMLDYSHQQMMMMADEEGDAPLMGMVQDSVDAADDEGGYYTYEEDEEGYVELDELERQEEINGSPAQDELENLLQYIDDDGLEQDEDIDEEYDDEVEELSGVALHQARSAEQRPTTQAHADLLEAVYQSLVEAQLIGSSLRARRVDSRAAVQPADFDQEWKEFVDKDDNTHDDGFEEFQDKYEDDSDSSDSDSSDSDSSDSDSSDSDSSDSEDSSSESDSSDSDSSDSDSFDSSDPDESGSDDSSDDVAEIMSAIRPHLPKSTRGSGHPGEKPSTSSSVSVGSAISMAQMEGERQAGAAEWAAMSAEIEAEERMEALEAAVTAGHMATFTFWSEPADIAEMLREVAAMLLGRNSALGYELAAMEAEQGPSAFIYIEEQGGDSSVHIDGMFSDDTLYEVLWEPYEEEEDSSVLLVSALDWRLFDDQGRPNYGVFGLLALLVLSTAVVAGLLLSFMQLREAMSFCGFGAGDPEAGTFVPVEFQDAKGRTTMGYLMVPPGVQMAGAPTAGLASAWEAWQTGPGKQEEMDPKAAMKAAQQQQPLVVARQQARQQQPGAVAEVAGGNDLAQPLLPRE